MSGSGGASLTSHERSTKITLQGYSSGNDSDGTESDADREYNKVTCERKQELWSILNTVENEYDKRVEREKGAESFLTYCKKYSHENSPGLLLNCYGPSGLKPLHYLSKVGGSEFIQFAEILLRFCDSSKDVVNSVGTACGESPLQLAVYGGHVAAVKWLLSRGANVYLADRFGNSAIDIARKKSNLPYPFENFNIILDMIENHIDFRSDVSLAEAYRIEGNKLFKERNFKRAIVKYSNSLQLASDHRTYSNRSQCYLNLAKLHREIETNFQYRIKGIEFYHELYENALADAEAARAMEPRYSKSHYRGAIALLGMGNFHGALEILYAGLRQCGNSDSSVSFLNNMMKNILDKLQLTKTEVDKLYGRLMPSLVANEVYTGKKEESTSNLLSSSVSSPGHSLCDFDRIPSNMCMWCEKLIPWSMMHIQQDHDTPEILDREIVGEANLPLFSFAQKGQIEHCPLCFCNFYDKISPQILRDQYLGGNTFPL